MKKRKRNNRFMILPLRCGFTGFLTAIILIVLVSVETYPQTNAGRSLRIMFYNVENLFDTGDDPLTDDEFLPDGARRWNEKRYEAKLKSIGKVIMAAGNPGPPEIIGLCEVENRKVVDDLLNASPLSRKYSFEIIHKDSDDPRGIDVCLIFQTNRLRLLTFRYLYPDEFSETGIRTREVLYTKWLAFFLTTGLRGGEACLPLKTSGLSLPG